MLLWQLFKNNYSNFYSIFGNSSFCSNSDIFKIAKMSQHIWTIFV